MKIYMQLTASEDGIVQFAKQPGIGLDPGDITGVLTLDDRARVKHANPFEGLLPSVGAPVMSTRQCDTRSMRHRERFRVHRQLPWVSADPDQQGNNDPQVDWR